MTEIGEPVSPGASDKGKEPKPGKLKVKVVDKCTGDAIEGAEVVVRVNGRPVKKKSDASGLADFGEVPARDYIVKIKMHYTQADYFLILVHYPRATWKQKAIVEAVSSATVPEGGAVEQRVEIKVFRVVAAIVFKRKQINLRAADRYGHWWTELGGESYGWWPSRGVGLVDTFVGVPGALNGVPHFARGTPTRDPHHGDVADMKFSPVIDDCRSDNDLMNVIRAVARGYSGKWSWRFELGNHCHTFQKKTITAVKARGFKDV